MLGMCAGMRHVLCLLESKGFMPERRACLEKGMSEGRSTNHPEARMHVLLYPSQQAHGAPLLCCPGRVYRRCYVMLHLFLHCVRVPWQCHIRCLMPHTHHAACRAGCCPAVCVCHVWECTAAGAICPRVCEGVWILHTCRCPTCRSQAFLRQLLPHALVHGAMCTARCNPSR